MKYFVVAYLAVVVLLSLVTFAAYGFDKHRAQNDGRRVPENTLHLMALLGGWPGAWIGQRVFRHKTHKLSFRVVFWFVALLHIALVGGFVYLIRA